MLSDKKREELKKKLPVDDPNYITFKKLKGVLGVIDVDKVREEKTNEIIARYKCSS